MACGAHDGTRGTMHGEDLTVVEQDDRLGEMENYGHDKVTDHRDLPPRATPLTARWHNEVRKLSRTPDELDHQHANPPGPHRSRQ